jgi:hypothetical protein
MQKRYVTLWVVAAIDESNKNTYFLGRQIVGPQRGNLVWRRSLNYARFYTREATAQRVGARFVNKYGLDPRKTLEVLQCYGNLLLL